jgi:hypothetical protein
MFEFGLGEVFQIGQFVARSFIDPDQLVEFEMQRCTIVVLRVLDKKHHQERDDRGARIDDQLPGIGKLKNRPGHRPDNDERARDREGGRAAALPRRSPSRQLGGGHGSNLTALCRTLKLPVRATGEMACRRSETACARLEHSGCDEVASSVGQAYQVAVSRWAS